MGVVGIRALKQNASAVVARAAAGEIITVTDRGRPVAQITPLTGSKLERLIHSGLATRASRAVSDLPMPAEHADGPRLSETLTAMREDERG
jgi:prevent-host-death family protein